MRLPPALFTMPQANAFGGRLMLGSDWFSRATEKADTLKIGIVFLRSTSDLFLWGEGGTSPYAFIWGEVLIPTQLSKRTYSTWCTCIMLRTTHKYNPFYFSVGSRSD